MTSIPIHDLCVCLWAQQSQWWDKREKSWDSFHRCTVRHYCFTAACFKNKSACVSVCVHVSGNKSPWSDRGRPTRFTLLTGGPGRASPPPPDRAGTPETCIKKEAKRLNSANQQVNDLSSGLDPHPPALQHSAVWEWTEEPVFWRPTFSEFLLCHTG